MQHQVVLAAQELEVCYLGRDVKGKAAWLAPDDPRSEVPGVWSFFLRLGVGEKPVWCIVNVL